MSPTPAVVIIARHGMRLDAADQTWHLSTPTPYDPPLTYGGWSQSRALGQRIASLLHAREQESEHASSSAQRPPHASSTQGHIPPRKRKKKHRVVIHSSPFLRCLQTSVGIAAGIAQFEPPREHPSPASHGSATNGAPGSPSLRPTTSRYRTAAQLYSASSRYRNIDSTASTPNLASIGEARHDFANEPARRARNEIYRRPRQTKLRVDAFLGEWLNPEYFEHITPPPPSCMMLASAKAELAHTESVDVYQPSAPVKAPVAVSTSSNLWNGTATRVGLSRESTLDDWSPLSETLPTAPLSSSHRDRASSTSSMGSIGSSDSCSGRKSPFRSGHVLQPLTSTISHPYQYYSQHQHHYAHHTLHHHIPKSTVYTPPTPSYAVSSGDKIPRGYVSHARTACVAVDSHWDSSRGALDWGNGGELPEEWSSMHKRFRHGVNGMMEWYSRHNADDSRSEDALGLDQAEQSSGEDINTEDDEEDLVVVLVTHSAGCNALIGAFTNQPVLIDIGMASLTMAVRREGAAELLLPHANNIETHSTHSDNEPPRRRSNLDIGLSSAYEMKILASTEHLRTDAGKGTSSSASARVRRRNSQPRNKHHRSKSGSAYGTPGGSHTALDSMSEIPRSASRGSVDYTRDHARTRSSNTSSALGSIRRPSLNGNLPSRQGSVSSQHSGGMGARMESFTNVLPVFTTSAGLWQPQSAGSTPAMSPYNSSPAPQPLNFGDLSDVSTPPPFTPPEEEQRRLSIPHNPVWDYSNSPPDSPRGDEILDRSGVPTVLAPRPAKASARSAVAKFVIGSLDDDDEDDEDDDENVGDGEGDEINAEQISTARTARAPIVHTTDGSCLDADEKSTQRDSVLGASESHDQLTPNTGPISSVAPSPLYLPLNAQPPSSSEQGPSSEVEDMLPALPPPSREFHAATVSSSRPTVSAGLWAGKSDRNEHTQILDASQQTALRDIVARRFDLQPKRRWTALPEPENLPIGLLTTAVVANDDRPSQEAKADEAENSTSNNNTAHLLKISLPSPPNIASFAVGSTTAPPTPLRLPEASQDVVVALPPDSISLSPSPPHAQVPSPPPAAVSRPPAMLWQREITTK